MADSLDGNQGVVGSHEKKKSMPGRNRKQHIGKGRS